MVVVVEGGKSASDRWAKEKRVSLPLRTQNWTGLRREMQDGPWQEKNPARGCLLPPEMDVLVSLLSQRAVVASGGYLGAGRGREGGRGGVTGEIWESSLGFERPSFGPAMASGWMPQAPGPCWGCLSICVSRASGASTVRLCHDAPTAGDQLGAFDLFSARHDPSSTSPTHVGRRQTWPNPQLESRDTRSRAPAAVSCRRPKYARPVALAGSSKRRAPARQLPWS